MDAAYSSSVFDRAFRLALTVEGLRPHTIHYYTREVVRLMAYTEGRPPKSITSAGIRAYIASLQEKYAAKTVHEAQLSIRRFFRFLLKEREIRRDPMSDMKLVRYRVEPQPTYTEAEVKRLLLVCDPKIREGLRDHALIMVLFDTGAREGELVSMHVPDWDKRVVQVDGKTGVRQVFLGTTALQAIERYARKWGIVDGLPWRGRKGPLTGSGVLQAVRKLCRRAAPGARQRVCTPLGVLRRLR